MIAEHIQTLNCVSNRRVLDSTAAMRPHMVERVYVTLSAFETTGLANPLRSFNPVDILNHAKLSHQGIWLLFLVSEIDVAATGRWNVGRNILLRRVPVEHVPTSDTSVGVGSPVQCVKSCLLSMG